MCDMNYVQHTAQEMQNARLTRLAKARPDVVLLAGNTLVAVNCGVKDIVVHVSQGAHCVKEQLGPVLAFHSD